MHQMPNASRNVPIHFIFASPRSGTTWLADALNQHPEILATEQRLFGNFCELWPDTDGKASARQTWDYFGKNFLLHYHDSFLGKNASIEEKEQFQESWMNWMLHHLVAFGLNASGKSILVDKVTPYLGTSGRVLRQIQHYYPWAKIIHLVRDGRDVVTSGTFDWVTRAAPDAQRHRFYVQREPGLVLQRFFDDPILDTWCRYWKEPQAAVEHWRAQDEFKHRWLTVHYEDMLEDQTAQLVKIFKFLGVRCTPELARESADAASFQTRTGRPRGQDDPTAKTRKGVHGDWQNYFTRADAEHFDAHCGHWLYHHRYTTDKQWIQNCPEKLELTNPRPADLAVEPPC